MLIDNQKKKKRALNCQGKSCFYFQEHFGISSSSTDSYLLVLVIFMILEHSVTPEVNIYSHWTSTEPSKSSLRCQIYTKVKRNSQTFMAQNHQLLNSASLAVTCCYK